MISNETWQIAIDALRGNRFRTFLTMLGIVIGSGCLVLVVTIGLTGNRYIMRQIEGIGSNIVYASLVAPGPSIAKPLADEITSPDMEALRQVVGVIRVAGTYDIQMSTVVRGAELSVTVVGVTNEFQTIRNLDVVSGRFLDPMDIQSRAKACVISEELARHWGKESPIGESISIGGIPLVVIGVFRERVATFGQSEITAESLLVPLGLTKYYTGDEYLKTVYAQAETATDVPGVTKGVAETLAARHRRGAQYNVQNLTALLNAARNISRALMLVLLVIALTTLLISGVGIMNIMLVTVRERTREIGVRMAVGAKRTEILYQFLLEALIISATGATAGILIALTIPTMLRAVLPAGMALPISWISVLVSFAVSCLIGLIFGILPARRAASLQPTEALHYE
jgi:putative ABC transport system permease protein